MPRRVSRADIELAAAVGAELGQPFTPRQLSRLREDGYIDPHEQWSVGRPGGRASAFPPERVGQVVALVRASARAKARDEAVLLAFGDQQPGLTELAVRRAYASYLERVERYLRDFSDSADPETICSDAGRALAARAVRGSDGRRWRKRLRGRTRPPQAELELAMANAVSLLLYGRSLSDDHRDAFLAAIGISAAATDMLPDIGPLAPDFDPSELDRAYERFSLPALAALIERIEFEALVDARDEMREIVMFLKDAGAVLGRLSPSGNGFGLAEAAEANVASVTALVAPAKFVFEELGYPIEALLHLARRFVSVYRAGHQLLRVLPRTYGRYFAPDGPEALGRKPEYLQRSIRERLAAALTADPDAARTIAAASEQAE